jgi:hypothetical protein
MQAYVLPLYRGKLYARRDGFVPNGLTTEDLFGDEPLYPTLLDLGTLVGQLTDGGEYLEAKIYAASVRKKPIGRPITTATGLRIIAATAFLAYDSLGDFFDEPGFISEKDVTNESEEEKSLF